LHVGQFIQIDSQPVHRRSHLATRGLLSPSPRFCCPDSELLRRCHDTTPEVDDYRAGITLIAKRHGVNAAMPWRIGTGRQLFACQPRQWTFVVLSGLAPIRLQRAFSVRAPGEDGHLRPPAPVCTQ
jgi:hypothetical protein